MIKLDMTANRLIHLDLQRKEFAYSDPCDFKLWLELFVVGDVPLTDEHTWETIKKPIQNKSAQRRKCKESLKYQDKYDQYNDDAYDQYDDEDDDDDDHDDDHDDHDGHNHDSTEWWTIHGPDW